MNKKIFIIALTCCMFICNAIVNTASATKLEKFHDMLHNNKYMMVYTEQSLFNNDNIRQNKTRITWVKDGANEYYSNRMQERNGFYHRGWLCVDGEYYQVIAVEKAGKQIEYHTHNSKSGIEKIPSDEGKSMLKNNHINQLIQLIYAGDNAMMKLRYVGEGALDDGTTYEDYVSYFDAMGIKQDGAPVRYIFSGDELKKIISKSVMTTLQGVSTETTDIVEFEKFTDIIDTDYFQLPVTQKVYTR